MKIKRKVTTMLENQQTNQGFNPGTFIATIDGNIEIKKLYLKNDTVLAWSYNNQEHFYELKKIKIKKNNTRLPMFKIIFEYNSYLIFSSIRVSSDNNSVRSFEKSSSDYINHYPPAVKIKRIIPIQTISESYIIIESDNNNCAVIPISNKNPQRGIIVNI